MDKAKHTMKLEYDINKDPIKTLEPNLQVYFEDNKAVYKPKILSKDDLISELFDCATDLTLDKVSPLEISSRLHKIMTTLYNVDLVK